MATPTPGKSVVQTGSYFVRRLWKLLRWVSLPYDAASDKTLLVLYGKLRAFSPPPTPLYGPILQQARLDLEAQTKRCEAAGKRGQAFAKYVMAGVVLLVGLFAAEVKWFPRELPGVTAVFILIVSSLFAWRAERVGGAVRTPSIWQFLNAAEKPALTQTGQIEALLAASHEPAIEGTRKVALWKEYQVHAAYYLALVALILLLWAVLV